MFIEKIHPPDALQKMRLLDDKIIYLLNTTIPTESFKGQADPTVKCKDLFQQIQSGHSQREIAIKKCLNAARERLHKLKTQKDMGQEDPLLIKNLRKEQNRLRLLQSELSVEEIVKNRTTQVYYERCRRFYKPNMDV
ncbi:coiled-coil domain-containing protein 58 isoform X2 [Orussus abietinus]|uniref:coiled-coil domain-containing protein 58 isoform X2 n=1 Tax=Orussus abietinus TaxID=222816 RepID=UPI000626715E|nr:coiled-coil domain-containing protein 58 isoform X2 [Orussus abietinus]